MRRMETVLKRIGEAGLAVKVPACKMGAAKVQYMGHQSGGWQVFPETSNTPQPYGK